MTQISHDRTDQTMRIYSSKICGWAKRNYAALLEKNVGFVLTSAKNAEGIKSAEFLALSPTQKTPVLKHQDVVVWESRIINEYIEEVFPGVALMPSDPGLRARARSLSFYCDDVLIPLISKTVRTNAQKNDIEELTKAVLLLDKFAFEGNSPGPYWAGTEFSLVDICYLNFFDNLAYVINVLDGQDLKVSQRLDEWGAAIGKRPSVIRAASIAAGFAKNEETTVITF